MRTDITPKQADAIWDRWYRQLTAFKAFAAYEKINKENAPFNLPKTRRDALKLRAMRYIDSVIPAAPFLPC